MSAAAYGEYVTIDEHLAKVKFRSGTNNQEPNPHEIINMQDSYGLTMLMEAARNNSYETVEYLLKRGADVHLRDRNGCTALHYACSEASVRIIQLIVDSGADVNAQDGEGKTPLHYANEHNRNGIGMSRE
ncbi:hypothetical protein BLSTO_02900 [Blastocystis sp. subtype 1]